MELCRPSARIQVTPSSWVCSYCLVLAEALSSQDVCQQSKLLSGDYPKAKVRTYWGPDGDQSCPLHDLLGTKLLYCHGQHPPECMGFPHQQRRGHGRPVRQRPHVRHPHVLGVDQRQCYVQDPALCCGTVPYHSRAEQGQGVVHIFLLLRSHRGA